MLHAFQTNRSLPSLNGRRNRRFDHPRLFKLAAENSASAQYYSMPHKGSSSLNRTLFYPPVDYTSPFPSTPSSTHFHQHVCPAPTPTIKTAPLTPSPSYPLSLQRTLNTYTSQSSATSRRRTLCITPTSQNQDRKIGNNIIRKENSL
jgi:hypothetical protein